MAQVREETHTSWNKRIGTKIKFVREWRKLQLASVAPGVLFLSYFFLLPKSVRWLVQKGRHREAHAAIVKVAKGNCKDEIAQGELQLYRYLV